MADKPHFSPNDTYVLDETVIKRTEELRLTGILRDLEESEEELADSDSGETTEGSAKTFALRRPSLETAHPPTPPGADYVLQNAIG